MLLTLFRVIAVIMGIVCVCAVGAAVLLYRFAPAWAQFVVQYHTKRRAKYREGYRRG